MSEDILRNLDSQQRAVLLCNSGPALVLAGAGSGKTTVITHKYAYLYKNNKREDSHVLAVTFTNKAARQMQERICEIVAEDVAGSWIGTLQALCSRILRMDCEALAIQRDFVIYDADDQARLVRHILNDMKEYEALYKGILSKIMYFKSSFISPDEQIQNEGNFALDEKLRKIYARYKDELKRSNALDLDDLILYTIKMFEENASILKKYQDMFSYVLVDEFQDTNYAQYHLLKLLVNDKHCILVAGDDDQSIKKGVEGDNFIEKFEEDFPKTNVFKLEQNYRCTQSILSITNSVISKNKTRRAKKLWTERSEGERVSHHWFDSEFDADDQARLVRHILNDMKEY
ncbi:MAG: UvrD-helicase domain-containing protein, partial [Candidatus Magnetoovum sp. WYHC-5]|nr:UvrD-helicase domain-containing protein [Candidatus Magnetoovum sp. WYHC-5]